MDISLASRFGLAVIHNDGDAGVITGFEHGKWKIHFCSGYQGNFPEESARDKDVFAWFPVENAEHVTPTPALAEKLTLLSALVNLINRDKLAEARNEWIEASCASWLSAFALEALIGRREASRREELKAEINCLLDTLEIDQARRRYDDTDACRWWPEPEYSALEARAVSTKAFVAAYQSGKLSELDLVCCNLLADRCSLDDLACLKVEELELRLARLGMPLDREQLLACARPEPHRMIRARAGSGKTRTLAALAALTIHDEALNPDQVLILAFNKKAATEIGDRVRGAAGIDEFRNARTFHSLAWQLADHAGRELIFDDGNLAPSRRKQTGFVERLIQSIMNPTFRDRLYEFFRRELEQMDRLGSNLSFA